MFTFVNPGQAFGPAEALAVYKNLPVTTPDGIVTVSVNNYRNLNNDEAHGGCGKALEVKDAILQGIPGAARRVGGNQPFMDVFTGKGAPQDIVAVLEMLVESSGTFCSHWGKASKASQGGKCAGYLADPTISWQDTLQRICDAWIGLDCNGFVGNWLKVVAPAFKFNSGSKSNDVRRKAVTYRTAVADIEYWDVMCYVHNEHIAAVNGSGSAPNTLEVCQSAGGGPRSNDYRFLQVTDNTFKLAAPQKGDIGNSFYVVSLW
jgi:hypothetical protein